MFHSTIKPNRRQRRSLSGKQGRPATTSTHKAILSAIPKGEILRLNYQGNPRSIVPLVYGQLKNGKRAILCYKLSHPGSGLPELALRLYHLEKVSHLEGTGETMEVNRKIDYYLTKHFATVFQKC